MRVWKDQDRQGVCRFGIAGDFLPAAGLAPADGESWAGQAERARAIFDDLEFGIVNLECPVDVEGIPPRVKASLGDTFAATAECFAYLDALKLSIVGIANNHLYDYGRAGAERTLDRVQGKFAVCGFGRTLAALPAVSIRTAAGRLRVGVWAAARNLPEAATRDSPGIEPATADRAAEALAVLEAGGAQCRVAFLHAGAEGTNFPDPDDTRFIDHLAESGFDIVAACHSHRISGYRTVPGRNGNTAHCFYGLGSLSSGVVYSPLEQEGILAVASLDASGRVAEVEARPLVLDRHGWGTAPSTLESRPILDRFEAVSGSIRDGSYRQEFYREVSRDLMGTQWRDLRVAFERAGLRGVLKKLTRMRPAHLRRLYHKSLASLGFG